MLITSNIKKLMGHLLKGPIIKLILVDVFFYNDRYVDFNAHMCFLYPEGQCAWLRVITKQAHYGEDLWSSRGQRSASALR